MKSDATIAFPLPALWIGPSTTLYEQTLPYTNAYFCVRWLKSHSELSIEELVAVDPGSPIMLEFEDAEHGQESFQAFDRIVHGILEYAKMPVILCLGHQIPAEAVVDWMRAGIYSYVERSADAAHFQKAFSMLALHARSVQQQHLRFERLMGLWSSISEREANVLDMLLEGLPNKTIASRLGVSQRTIEARRHNLYEKLESRSVAEVVRIIYELDNLEHIFHRIDAEHRSPSVLSGKAPRLPNLERVALGAAPRVPIADARESPGSG